MKQLLQVFGAECFSMDLWVREGVRLRSRTSELPVKVACFTEQLLNMKFFHLFSSLWFFMSQHKSANSLSSASHYFTAPPNDKYCYKAPRWSLPPPDHESSIIRCLLLSQQFFLGAGGGGGHPLFLTNECDDTLIAGCSQADVQWLLIECGGLGPGGIVSYVPPPPHKSQPNQICR